MYETLRDASFRLDGTVVFYKNRYLLVERCKTIGGDTHIISGDLQIPISSKLLKIRCIPTGYVTIGGDIFFISRRPTRRYRQGLRQDNTRVYDHNSREVSFQRLLGAVVKGGLVNLIPKDGEVISKDFAVVGKVLWYRLREVGYVIDGKAHLRNDLQFLKEAVQEYMEVA